MDVIILQENTCDKLSNVLIKSDSNVAYFTLLHQVFI